MFYEKSGCKSVKISLPYDGDFQVLVASQNPDFTLKELLETSFDMGFHTARLQSKQSTR